MNALDQNSNDRFMATALRLAKRGLGNVWPNPAVGCLIVRYRGGQPVIASRGWTQPGGRPHAETAALAQLQSRLGADAARGAVVYVSLEPCSHHGRTPPCADALIDAGVGRVFVACEDPDPRVRGRGVARLRSAGIEVVTGLLRESAEAVNAGFISRVCLGRPLVTWKTATSLDGRIATASGHSQWITGDAARAQTQLDRASYDAILVGVGTAVQDNPRLTSRLPGMSARSPLRIVLDSRLRTPMTGPLVTDAPNTPTWIVTRDDNGGARVAAFRDLGVEIIELPAGEDQRLDIGCVLRELGNRGITRLLVEGRLRCRRFVHRCTSRRPNSLVSGAEADWLPWACSDNAVRVARPVEGTTFRAYRNTKTRRRLA